MEQLIMAMRPSQQYQNKSICLSVNPTLPIKRLLRQIHPPIRMTSQIGPVCRPPEMIAAMVDLGPNFPVLHVRGKVDPAVGVAPEIGPMDGFPKEAVAVDVDTLPFLPGVVIGGKVDEAAGVSSQARFVKGKQIGPVAVLLDLPQLLRRDCNHSSSLQLQVHCSAGLHWLRLGEADSTLILEVFAHAPEEPEDGGALAEVNSRGRLLRKRVSYSGALVGAAEETVKAVEIGELPLIFGHPQVANAAGHSVCLTARCHTHHSKSNYNILANIPFLDSKLCFLHALGWHGLTGLQACDFAAVRV